MGPTSDYAALLANRENFYRLLARLYRVELDQTLLDGMTRLRFPVAGDDAEMAAGGRMLESWLRRPGPDPLTTLAVDYARVFLGAGIVDGLVAYPYESVYTNPDRLIMQDARDQVVAAYRAEGLDASGAVSGPEDHVALELEFMAHLCQDARRAAEAGDADALASSLERQRTFLVQHLCNWVPSFCADIQACAETDFYKGLARITVGYLRMDDDILAALAASPVSRDVQAAC